MKRYGKPCIAGAVYGFLPVILAWLLIRNLWILAALIGKLAGLESGIAQQITDALRQLQSAELALPWFAGIILAAACIGVLLWLQEYPKLRKALTAVGIVLILPLTLCAACLAVVNEIRVWNVITSLLPLLKAL